MKKLNNLVKLGLLVLVALVLFGLAIFIIHVAEKKTNRFAEYSTNPYNDDITVNVQVIETRQNPKESNYKYEYSKYDVYLFVTKKTTEDVVTKEISGIYTYLCSKSGKKYNYTQTQTSKKMSATSYSTSTMSLLNSTIPFAYFDVVTDEDGKVKSIDNRKPEEMYVKVAYSVKTERKVRDADGNVVKNGDDDVTETVEYTAELNYKFNIEELKIKDLSNYEKRELNGSNVVSGDDLFKLGIYRSVTAADEEAKKGAYDNFKINKLETNADKMPANVFIDNIYLSIYGEIGNESLISSEYFNKYVRLFVYTGSLARAVSAIRTATILQEYNIQKLYVSAVVKTTDGKTYTTKYYLNVSELLTN